MTFYPDKEEEIRRQEQALHERERALRLRELELELNQPPLQQPVKHTESHRSSKLGLATFAKWGKFFAIVLVVAIAFHIAGRLASLLIVVGIVWVLYKLFFEGDRPRS